ncbi:MAG TPA: DUF2341 domain-containing protein [Candidatus Nanoarchaeia archaeon]|nr:DUF2341 domain-containing protein [Candidatus Nanoarchaeia archaeon]
MIANQEHITGYYNCRSCTWSNLQNVEDDDWDTFAVSSTNDCGICVDYEIQDQQYTPSTNALVSLKAYRATGGWGSTALYCRDFTDNHLEMLWEVSSEGFGPGVMDIPIPLQCQNGSHISLNFEAGNQESRFYEANISFDTLPVWHDPSWSNRKPIYIQENSNSDLTNYEYNILIDQEPEMNADFSDLRFIDAAGNVLPYWIEAISGTQASVWIRVAQLSAGSSSAVYMYYGNPTAQSKSNRHQTFHVYLDFEDANQTLPYPWEELDPNSYFQYSTDAADGLYSGYSPTDWGHSSHIVIANLSRFNPIPLSEIGEIKVSLKKEGCNTAYSALNLYLLDPSNYCSVEEEGCQFQIAFGLWNSIDGSCESRVNNNTYAKKLENGQAGSWRSWTLQLDNDREFVDIYYEGNNYGTIGIGNFSGLGAAALRLEGNAHGSYADSIIIRNLVHPEPTSTLGAVEIYPTQNTTKEYYTKDEIDALLQDYVTQNEFQSALQALSNNILLLIQGIQDRLDQIGTYLQSLPRGLRQQMICSYMRSEQITDYTDLGLQCRIQNGWCTCRPSQCTGNNCIALAEDQLAPVINLQKGWNLFGYGEWQPYYWFDGTISDGQSVKTIQAAEQDGWIQGTIYYFDAGFYKLVPGDDDFLQKDHGYWIYASKDNLTLSLQ